MGFHRPLGVIKLRWHQESTWSPRLSRFRRLGRHGGKANLSPQISCGAENPTLSVSPGTLCAFVMFGGRTRGCQLFLSQNHWIFPQGLPAAGSLAQLGEDTGFLSGSPSPLSRATAETPVLCAGLGQVREGPGLFHLGASHTLQSLAEAETEFQGNPGLRMFL